MVFIYVIRRQTFGIVDYAGGDEVEEIVASVAVKALPSKDKAEKFVAEINALLASMSLQYSEALKVLEMVKKVDPAVPYILGDKVAYVVEEVIFEENK